MTGYTPGPWELRQDGIYADGGKLATVTENYSDNRSEANARLIALAPRMVALIGKAVFSLEAQADFGQTNSIRQYNRPLADEARALLAEIEGGEK